MTESGSGLPLGPLIVDIASTRLQAGDDEILSHPLVGGVILFTRNFENPAQLKLLVREIKAVRHPQLLVCVDQEGGRVQRFRKGFTELPPLRAIGRLYHENAQEGQDAARTMAGLMATEVRASGADFSFAPVVDRFDPQSRIIAERAFDSDPQILAKLAGAYMQGLHEAGMIAVAKHYPGHGGVREDSHVCLPEDGRNYGEIRDKDLAPYRALIANGLDAVMTAHVRFMRVDCLPPGFSRFWIRTILRKQLGFSGAVLTDDLSMQGAVEFGSVTDRTRLALEAGCDMALICNDRLAVENVLDAPGLEQFIRPGAKLENQLRREPEPGYMPPDEAAVGSLLDRLWSAVGSA